MKTIKILTAALLLLATVSCDDFLETAPIDSLSPVNYYNTEKDLNYALNGVYEVLGNSDLYSDFLYYQFDIADEGFYSLNTLLTGTQLYNFSPSEPTITGT